jgi:hypothetical protein
MYTKEQFHETVGILVRAYMNDTLEHGNYCACAVGNLIAEKVGATLIYEPMKSGSKFSWSHPEFNGYEWYCVNPTRKMITESGYKHSDLMRIEKAFEHAEKPDDVSPNDFMNDKWMFNGLMAVVDILCEIHDMNETEKQEAKEMFVKA